VIAQPGIPPIPPADFASDGGNARRHILGAPQDRARLAIAGETLPLQTCRHHLREIVLGHLDEELVVADGRVLEEPVRLRARRQAAERQDG
jgi:hypothetical protein